MSMWDFIVALYSFIIDVPLFSRDAILVLSRFMSATMDFGMPLVFFGISLSCFEEKKSVPLVSKIENCLGFSSVNCRV